LNRPHQCHDRVAGGAKVRTRRRSAPAEQRGKNKEGKGHTKVIATVVSAEEPMETKQTKRKAKKQQQLLAKRMNAVTASVATSSTASSAPSLSSIPPSTARTVATPITPITPQSRATTSIVPSTPNFKHEDDVDVDDDEYDYDSDGDAVSPSSSDLVDAADSVDAAPSLSHLTISYDHAINNSHKRSSSPSSWSTTTSPSRKRDRRAPTEGESSSSSSRALVPMTFGNDNGGDYMASQRSAAETALAEKWAQKLMVSLPQGIMITFDESNVIRSAMSDLVPWLKNNILNQYSPRADGYDWVKQMTHQVMRVCPKWYV
jgi:hypothetical protein